MVLDSWTLHIDFTLFSCFTRCFGSNTTIENHPKQQRDKFESSPVRWRHSGWSYILPCVFPSQFAPVVSHSPDTCRTNYCYSKMLKSLSTYSKCHPSDGMPISAGCYFVLDLEFTTFVNSVSDTCSVYCNSEWWISALYMSGCVSYLLKCVSETGMP